MPLVEANGINLWADVAGSGPPVVLLHGFTGSSGTWRPFTAATGGRYTTIAFDHIGHGRSDAPVGVDHYRMDSIVDDLAAAVRSLGYERAAWAGYSMGGRTALQVACKHPEIVGALILEGASPGLASLEDREARVAADERLAQMIETDGLDAFVDYWESIPLWGTQQRTLTPEQRQALRAQRLAQRDVGLANSLRGMGTGSQEWVGDRLDGIRVPVLLSAGRLDTRYVEAAEQMARSIPDVRVQFIDDAGHAAHLERPDDFNAMVIEFLDEVWANS